MTLLENKRALIFGLASNRSIAWGIAKNFYQQGAELALICQNERLRERVQKLAKECGDAPVFICDVSEQKQIKELFKNLAATLRWQQIDCLVHSLAFAPREALAGSFLETQKEAFLLAHEISSYSLTALAREARKFMSDQPGAILTLSYIGATRAIPNYNVMGLAKASLEANVRYLANELGPQQIRVNAISAGPIRTLAAAGISGFRKMLEYSAKHAPLRRNVSIDDVGQAAAFLCSPLASGITGEILFVDAGFHILGLTLDE